jgi:tetratricopeptide (TPR) repeat protein
MTLSQDESPDSATLVQSYKQIKALYDSNHADYHTGYMVGQLAAYMRDFDGEVQLWQTLDSVFPAKTDPAVNLANAYVKRYLTRNDTTDFNRAISIFNRLENGTGKDIGLTSQKVRAYALRNDTTAIVREVSELLRDKPADATAYLYAGSIYDSFGRDSDALSNYKYACQLDSTNGRAFVSLANFYRERGDSVAYDREVFQALQSSNLEFDAKYEMMRGYVSELYADTAQWPRIEHLFGVLEEENPGEPGVHLLYGAFENVRSNTQAAYEQFSYAMALDPSDSSVRMTVVQLAMSSDSLDNVIEVSKKGMELFPTNFYFPIMAAAGYNQQKRYDKAVEVLNSVDYSGVTNGKAVSNLLCTLADNYYLLDSLDLAFDTYEKAIRYDSDNYMAYNNAGYFLAESGRDIDKAMRYTRYAVLSEPQNPTYLDSYAWSLFKNKDYEKAKENIDLALKGYGFFADTDTAIVAEPDTIVAQDYDGEDADLSELVYSAEQEVSADVLSHAGDIYFMCGEPEAAIDFWKQAAALRPEDELLARKVKYKTYFYK